MGVVLDICFDEYNYNDSLQACLIEGNEQTELNRDSKVDKNATHQKNIRKTVAVLMPYKSMYCFLAILCETTTREMSLAYFGEIELRFSCS